MSRPSTARNPLAVDGGVRQARPMQANRPVLEDAAARAVAYATTIDGRRVFPDAAALGALTAFDEVLPSAGEPIEATLRLLDEVGSPATVASTGADYFGFVTGGTLPAALHARPPGRHVDVGVHLTRCMKPARLNSGEYSVTSATARTGLPAAPSLPDRRARP